MTRKKALTRRYGHAPARQETYLEALARNAWINEFEQSDPCLFETLLQACIAKLTAERAGGNKHDIASGEKMLDRIRDGRSKGQVAWRQAASAIRKFDEAYMGSRRT